MKRWSLIAGIACFLAAIAAGIFTNIGGQSAAIGGDEKSGVFMNEKPWVDVREYASINAAVDALGAENATLVVSNAQALTASLTIPSNIYLVIVKGGSITGGAANYTLTINGPFDAGLYQVFAGNGTVTFGAGTVKEVYPEWWYSGSGSWHTAFQKAVDSTTGRVQLSSRAYDLTDEVRFDNGSMQLIGQRGTVLYFDPTDEGLDGKVLLNCTRFRQAIYGVVFKDFSITMRGTGNPKTKRIGIRWTDVSTGTMENVSIIQFRGNGSIGLQLRGRHMYSIGKIVISADRPIVVEQDPSLWQMDYAGLEYCRFYDTYLAVLDPTQNAFHIEEPSNFERCIIDGYNAWSGGMNGFYYPSAFPGQDFKLSNIYWDSPGPLSGDGGYFVYVGERNNQPTLKVTLDNLHTGGAAGGYFFSGVDRLSMNNCDYLGTGTGISLDACNFATLINNDIRGTLSVSGMQEMLKAADPASTYLPRFVVYQNKGPIRYKQGGGAERLR